MLLLSEKKNSCLRKKTMQIFFAVLVHLRNKTRPRQNDYLGSCSIRLNLKAIKFSFALFSKRKSSKKKSEP